MPLSEDFVAKRRAEINNAAETYVSTLFTYMQCLDMSTENGVSTGHGIVNIVEQIRKMQDALNKPTENLTRPERKDAFGRR